jgi:8-oxo-dGTP pyrophosphatase MutT (NUDIX family)
MAVSPGNRPWHVLRSDDAISDRWLTLRRDLVAATDGTVSGPFPVVEQPHWVDVIALTPQRHILLVDQYRHPVGRLSTEFPAGAVDPGETPLAAIRRELLEETGYASDDWQLLGSTAVWPDRQDNRISTFLARNVRRVAEPSLDEGEALRCREMPLDEFIAGVEAGTLELPALQLAGLWWLSRRLRSSGAPGT